MKRFCLNLKFSVLVLSILLALFACSCYAVSAEKDIDFVYYGKVIDQYGQGVPDLEIEYQVWNREFDPDEAEKRLIEEEGLDPELAKEFVDYGRVFIRNVTLTDENGLFLVKARGFNIQVKEINGFAIEVKREDEGLVKYIKVEYDDKANEVKFKSKALIDNNYSENPGKDENNPDFYPIRIKENLAYLSTAYKLFSMSFTYQEPEKNYEFKLNNQWYDNEGNKYDERLVHLLIENVIIEDDKSMKVIFKPAKDEDKIFITDELLYVAPENGYKDEWEMDIHRGGVKDFEKFYMYLYLNNKYYTRLEWHFVSRPKKLYMDFDHCYLNPEGDRELDYDRDYNNQENERRKAVYKEKLRIEWEERQRLREERLRDKS